MGSSPCDNCPEPGACCQDFQLSQYFSPDAGPWVVQDWLEHLFDLAEERFHEAVCWVQRKLKGE